MEDDDDLQLNLAGFEAPSVASNLRSKENRRAFAFKKQQKVLTVGTCSQSDHLSWHTSPCLSFRPCVQKQKQAKHQSKRAQGDNGVVSLAAPSGAASALKGYNLTPDTAAEVLTSNLDITQPELGKTQAPAALVGRPSRKGRRISGDASYAQIQPHSRQASNPNAPHTSNIDEKRDNFARRAKRDRAAFEGELRR